MDVVEVRSVVWLKVLSVLIRWTSKSKVSEVAGFKDPDYNKLNGELRTEADRNAEDSGDYASGSSNQNDGGFGTDDMMMMSMMNRNNNNSGSSSTRPIGGETAPLERTGGDRILAGMFRYPQLQ